MTDLWLEVKDNDYYSQKLRELSYFRPTPITVGDFGAIMKEMYLRPIIEQLNRSVEVFNPGDALSVIMPKPKRKLYVKLAETRQSPEGKNSFELGVKAGYWPCLKAPFVSIALGYRRLDIWYGQPSYWPDGQPPENR